jgi:hypothetical protein
MQRKKVLLLGNGINRVDNDYSWDNLMGDLLEFAGLNDAVTRDEKPFPLLYEEIYLRYAALGVKKEVALKSKIKELLRNITSNALHEKVFQTQVDEILTTNYDYNLESASPNGLEGSPYIHPIKGSKYSLMRRRQVGDKVVWHIHGEKRAPGTILLGYEQYAGYLQTIRSYVISGIRYKNLHLPSVLQRIKKRETEVLTWIDHFFFSDIYIVGLSMDFVEMHLWWLLDIRARMLLDGESGITNKIQFIYPAHATAWIKPRIDLMCACDVSCMAVTVVDNDWKGMYEGVLAYVSGRE